MSMSRETCFRLCPLNSLLDRSARGFSIHRQGTELELLVVREGPGIHAYVNSCPHTGATLDWVPHQFLDAEGKHIQCATHGALFRLRDGYCVFGPCAGQSLTPVPVEVVDEDVVIRTVVKR